MQNLRLSYFCFLFLSWLLGSCASTFSRTQIIAIDSQPRGIEVSNRNGELLGKTPFVANFRRSRDFILYSELEKKKPTYAHHCSFRWVESGVGNLVFLAGALITIPIDLVSGAAYDCPSSVYLSSSNPANEEREEHECKRYLILPPHHKDALISDEIEHRGRAELKKQLKNCDSIIDMDESDHYFTHYGISHRSARREFPQHLYNSWMYASNANTLVDFSIDSTQSRLEIKEIDMFNGQKKVHSHALSKEKIEHVHPTNYWTWIEKFVPNTVVAGITGPFINHTINDEYELKELKRKNFLSGFFLKIDNINTPDSFATWDLDYDSDISYPIYYVGSEFLTENRKTKEEYTDEWIFLRMGINSQIEGIAYTPFGSFTLGLGLGPTYIYTKVNGDIVQNGITLIPTASLQYRAFFGENMYFTGDIYIPWEPAVSNERVKILSVGKVSVGIGYLFSTQPHHLFVRK